MSFDEARRPQSEPPHAAVAAQTRPSLAENVFWTATAAGMSILAVGLVALLANASGPHPARSTLAVRGLSTIMVVPEGMPVAPRPVVTLNPVMVSADARRAAWIAGAPVSSARSASAAVAPSPAAIPPRMVIPPLAPATPVAPVDLSRPAAALAIVMAGRRASSCTSLDANDARSTMHVSVTFAPSGRAASAAVLDGPFVGTAVGSCVTRVLRGVTVAPFDGEPVKVQTTMRLR